jgi:hypothetical protein
MAVAIGCATVPPEKDVPAHGAGACNAAPVQHMVGRVSTTSLAAEAQRRSGAGTWRWLRPGQIVTMEYRADRLNIVIDANDRITAIRCG